MRRTRPRPRMVATLIASGRSLGADVAGAAIRGLSRLRRYGRGRGDLTLGAEWLRPGSPYPPLASLKEGGGDRAPAPPFYSKAPLSQEGLTGRY